ncbi:hypothetical protein [Acidovorax sp. FJL06]|uniref:hypothetical protein n=1 Tax=Acidovorax sp. FJL06 TaxID=2153365 RepID=UPI000F56D622|nr:hypothetical protein [Acidovorax sp. FJL06]RQO82885.1 hypothetical protein DBV10_07155 [Acidovorax sp. FJL06]
MTTAKFSDILDGYEFCTVGDLLDTQAFVSLESGTVHIVSGDMELDEEAPPEDIETGPYLALPGKSELGLGWALAIEFSEQAIAADASSVRDFFRRRGAYHRFKEFLERRGQLDAWFEFERSAVESRLRQWCADHGIELV